jgi:hypothetical protein
MTLALFLIFVGGMAAEFALLSFLGRITPPDVQVPPPGDDAPFCFTPEIQSSIDSQSLTSGKSYVTHSIRAALQTQSR